MKLAFQPAASASPCSAFGIGMSPEGSLRIPVRGGSAACDPRAWGGLVCARVDRSNSGVLVVRASSGFGVSSASGSLRRVGRLRGGPAAACEPRVWGGSISVRSRSGVAVARARALPLPPAETPFFTSSGASDDDILNLEVIRKSLTVQENIIFYNLLERSELPLNIETYSHEACKVSGFSGTLMEFVMKEMEKIHARAGRYKHQGELPFFGDALLGPVFPLVGFPEVLHPYAVSINLNDVIWDLYFTKILPKLAKTGSDGNNGLSAVSDTKILQALSKRVHHSMFLAEVKFRASPDRYEAAIKDQSVKKLRDLLTHSEMDEANHRVENRIKTFGLLANQGESFKVKFELSCQLFDKYVVPLIIEVQVQYLLLKGRDGNPSSSGVRKIIRLKALSKTTQALVRAGPSLAYLAKMIGILTFAVMIGLKDQIVVFLNSKGLVPDKASLALLLICFVSAKGAYDALKKGKEVVELAKYYGKLLEKDKKEP